MYQNILWEQKDRSAVITLNRPRVLNALSHALRGARPACHPGIRPRASELRDPDRLADHQRARERPEQGQRMKVPGAHADGTERERVADALEPD